MSYFIENIFICLAAPFLIAAVILGREKKLYIHRFGNARLHRFGIS